MLRIIDILLQSGKSALELSLYTLLPIMVVMMALMKLLEAKGVLDFVAKVLTPVLKPFGIPGIGVFAILQSLLVSFAAPVATLSIMEADKTTSTRKIAATLAMVLTISQANVVFPMLTVGLNLWIVLLTSLIGGVVASSVTYYFLARSQDDGVSQTNVEVVRVTSNSRDVLTILSRGGYKGVQLVLRSIPILVLTICLVNALRAVGLIDFLVWSLSPALSQMHLPGIAVLPIATKFLAGGTAMMGISIPLVQEGGISAHEFNRLAGSVINPLDLVGVAVLTGAGPRVASVKRPAILGAIVGILIRTVLHFVIFR